MNDLDAVAGEVRADLERFGAVAKRYCDAIERWEANPGAMPTRDRLVLLEPLLAEVYMDASGLPLTDIWFSAEDDPAEAEDEPIVARPPLIPYDRTIDLRIKLELELGQVDGRREVFDPYWHLRADATSDDEVKYHGLSDDLVDVYRWLKTGLLHGTESGGSTFHAAWEWRFGFEVEGGRDALGALRAIHFLLYFAGGNDPESSAVLWTTVRTNV